MVISWGTCGGATGVHLGPGPALGSPSNVFTGSSAAGNIRFVDSTWHWTQFAKGG